MEFVKVKDHDNLVRDPLSNGIINTNNSDYDEYTVPPWPMSIPSFDVPENVFILRYSYDEYSEIDKFASVKVLFKQLLASCVV